MIKYLQDIPINNWPIINKKLIIGRTLSLQCQYFSLKNNKKRERGYICNITLECHSVLNLMTLDSYVSYFQQMEHILSADENDLIIVFSYTGSYFDYENLRALQKKLEAPKIWMITSAQQEYPYFVDEVLTFQSLQDQGSHPYQLQFIASLIAQEYFRRYKS